MASLKEIAEELGYSYTLVSKILNNRMGTTRARSSTREVILKKAKELDYRPNRLAVALRNGRKGAVGVFLHTMGVPGTDLTLRLVDAVSAGLAESGLHLWLRFFREDDEFLAACDENLKRDVDGLIIGGADHPALGRKLRQIDRDGLPVVSTFSETTKATPLPNVRLDYEMQGYLTTRHLLEQGCRRLVHFRHYDLRYRGFVRAHREAGVPMRRDLVIPARSFYIAAGVECMKKVLASRQSFDGIVAGSDAQAIGAMRLLLDKGISIPGQVKITGVDDSPLAQACQIPLTSVTAEMEDCGKLLAESLLKRIEGHAAKSVVLAPRLVTRASSRA